MVVVNTENYYLRSHYASKRTMTKLAIFLQNKLLLFFLTFVSFFLKKGKAGAGFNAKGKRRPFL